MVYTVEELAGAMPDVSHSGELVKTPDELAEQEQLRADRAEERAEKLAARLKELGLDPDM